MANSYKHILFIEDEVFIANLYADILRGNGFEVTCATDGDSGLKLAQTQPFDLILLDLMLPGISGIDLLTTLRDPAKSPDFKQTTPVFVFTNFDEDDITKKKLMTMAQAYLIKVNVTPLTLANMLKAMETGEAAPAGLDTPLQP